jgi:TPR repeat protein
MTDNQKKNLSPLRLFGHGYLLPSSVEEYTCKYLNLTSLSVLRQTSHMMKNVCARVVQSMYRDAKLYKQPKLLLTISSWYFQNKRGKNGERRKEIGVDENKETAMKWLSLSDSVECNFQHICLEYFNITGYERKKCDEAIERLSNLLAADVYAGSSSNSIGSDIHYEIASLYKGQLKFIEAIDEFKKGVEKIAYIYCSYDSLYNPEKIFESALKSNEYHSRLEESADDGTINTLYVKSRGSYSDQNALLLGRCYEYGFGGCEKDLKKTVKYYEESFIKNGDRIAGDILVRFYLFLEKDIEKALQTLIIDQRRTSVLHEDHEATDLAIEASALATIGQQLVNGYDDNDCNLENTIVKLSPSKDSKTTHPPDVETGISLIIRGTTLSSKTYRETIAVLTCVTLLEIFYRKTENEDEAGRWRETGIQIAKSEYAYNLSLDFTRQYFTRGFFAK